MKDTDVSPNVACSRRRFLTVSAAGLLVAGLPACSDSEDAGIRFTDTITYGRQAIQRHMIEAPDSPAVSVALLWKEQIVWQEAFGLASVTDKEPATAHTRFNIGSVSKVFAGLTGVILRDQGVLDLDAPVAQYLPEFTMLSPEFAQITSRHLLSHSSGLPGTNVRRVFSFAPMPGYAQDTQAGLAHFHLKHRPGEMAVYCNDGFTLFELVVLAVSGPAHCFAGRHCGDGYRSGRVYGAKPDSLAVGLGVGCRSTTGHRRSRGVGLAEEWRHCLL